MDINILSKVEFMDSKLHDIAYLPQFKDTESTNVSKASIAWHLDHSLKVINRIYDVLKSSDPTVYERRFHFFRTLSFLSRYIPRGRDLSPGFVLPSLTIRTEEILSQLEQARNSLKKLDVLDQNANFTHPIFGQLNRKQAKRFLEIHTKHHLKIISDILRD